MIGWYLAASALGAELWWVPDAERAASLRSALDAEWSGEPYEVVVGERPAEAFGWTWNGSLLAVHAVDTDRLADAQDPQVAVLFARTWNIRTETPGWERWLPAGEEALVAEDSSEPVEAVRAPPDPRQTPWSLALGVGTRTMNEVPSPMPSLRVPAELVVGSWFLAADVAADATPEWMGNQEGVVAGVQELFSANLESGIRSRGATWVSFAPGIQLRGASPTLAVDGRVVSRFERTVLAGVVDLGIGHDFGFVRVALHPWGRVSYTLPVSAGVDLEMLVFVHERRR